MTDIIGFVEDFTDEDPDPQPRPFRIDDDVFYVSAVAPAGTLIDLAKLASIDQTNAQQMAKAMETLADVLDSVMMPESAVRFAQRMRSPIRPIQAKQVMKIVRWLVQVYSGKDRTAPVSSSPTGLPSTGPSSTDGAPVEASIPGSFH